MKQQFPEAIELRVAHAFDTPLPKIAAAYAEATQAASKSSLVQYSADNLGLASGKSLKGSISDFREALKKTGKNPHFADFVTANGLTFLIVRREEAYEVKVTHPPSSTQKAEWPVWIGQLAKLSRDCIELPGFQYLSLIRRPKSIASFPPSPPLARTHHIVTVSAEEIADAYDDPDAFLQAWDKVETIKGVKYCTRALDKLDELSWIGRTFESQMAMARAAKPNVTTYAHGVEWDPRMAAWWEYGDLNDEKAGFPALAPYAYDEKTKTVDMAGFISKTPLEKGGPEPRHVQIREIYDIRDILEEKRDGDGRAIETINVIWPEKWMALSEKRPLLDVGAKVFYKDGKKRVEVT